MKHSLILLATLLMSATGHAQSAPTDWQPVGIARFTDGWLSPYFGFTADSDRTWEVPIEKSATSESYRLSDPYHQPGFTGKFATAPNTPSPHDIIIDCTDANYVTMECQPVFTFAEGIFSANTEQTIWGQSRAAFLEYTGRTREAIIRANLNCTLSDNTITIRQALIGFTSDPSDAQTWNAGAFDTIIVLPASSASNPIAGNSVQPSAAPEYYTLTGIRIPAPTRGAPYLLRIGTTVTKHIPH